MTWVIGACSLLGAYAITVSDVQITMPDGRTFDLVRKAYPVGPNLVGGFAGSVLVGFRLLTSVSRFLKLPPDASKNSGWHPAWVAEHWAPHAKRVFEKSEASQQSLGAQFILVGPDPSEDIGIPGRAMPYLCKFSAPDFRPEIVRGGNSALSIGSGSNVPVYIEELKEIMDPYAQEDGGFLKLEMGNVGGWANAINIAISFMLERHPIVGISQHVHTHIAAREGFKVMTSDRTMNLGTPEEIEFRMPRVAQNWSELMEMAKGLSIDAAKAVA